jgi:hypothetical protein
VLALYSGRRYEFEYKYTTYVNIQSRPTLPRIQLKTLVEVLQELEDRQPGTQQYAWSANQITDSGPMMRLEDTTKKLNKMERYGNPTDRPIQSSAVAAGVLEAAIVSYLRHAYFGRNASASAAETAAGGIATGAHNLRAASTAGIASTDANATASGATGRMSARRDWSWREIQDANATVDFVGWKAQVLPVLSAIADAGDGSSYLMTPGNQAMLR